MLIPTGHAKPASLARPRFPPDGDLGLSPVPDIRYLLFWHPWPSPWYARTILQHFVDRFDFLSSIHTYLQWCILHKSDNLWRRKLGGGAAGSQYDIRRYTQCEQAWCRWGCQWGPFQPLSARCCQPASQNDCYNGRRRHRTTLLRPLQQA